MGSPFVNKSVSLGMGGFFFSLNFFFFLLSHRYCTLFCLSQTVAIVLGFEYRHVTRGYQLPPSHLLG